MFPLSFCSSSLHSCSESQRKHALYLLSTQKKIFILCCFFVTLFSRIYFIYSLNFFFLSHSLDFSIFSFSFHSFRGVVRVIVCVREIVCLCVWVRNVHPKIQLQHIINAFICLVRFSGRKRNHRIEFRNGLIFRKMEMANEAKMNFSA